MKRILLTGLGLLALAGAPAVAADLPVKAPLLSPAPAYSWAGFYFGAHAGAAWGNFQFEAGAAGPAGTGGGFTFGGHLGHNWQWGRFVLGAEADLSWLDIKATGVTGSFVERWTSSLRLRFGHAFDRYLLYVTGGIAFTDTEHTVTGAGSGSQTAAGFTAGFGIETMLSPSWSGRLEALFADVPKQRLVLGGVPAVGGSQNFIVRAGISYHPFP